MTFFFPPFLASNPEPRTITSDIVTVTPLYSEASAGDAQGDSPFDGTGREKCSVGVELTTSGTLASARQLRPPQHIVSMRYAELGRCFACDGKVASGARSLWPIGSFE